jgi:hypothetical protein
MELTVLMWILGGGFAGTWGLCIFFMSRADAISSQIKAETIQMRNETLQMCTEIRAEISELKNCVKDHHARIAITEHELELE